MAITIINNKAYWNSSDETGKSWMIGEDFVDIKQYVAQRLNYTLRYEISIKRLDSILEKIELELILDDITDCLLFSIQSYIVALPDQDIVFHYSHPRDWWEFFKHRFFPKWLLIKYPVQYTCIHQSEKRFKAVCPHVIMDKHATHLQWMSRVEEKGEVNL
jgi:hypothetical protein